MAELLEPVHPTEYVCNWFTYSPMLPGSPLLALYKLTIAEKLLLTINLTTVPLS